MNNQYLLDLAYIGYQCLRLWKDVVAFKDIAPLSISGSKNHVLNLPSTTSWQTTSARNSLTPPSITLLYIISIAAHASSRLKGCCGMTSILNLTSYLPSSNARGMLPTGCDLRFAICSRASRRKKRVSELVASLSPTFVGKERKQWSSGSTFWMGTAKGWSGHPSSNLGLQLLYQLLVVELGVFWVHTHWLCKKWSDLAVIPGIAEN